MSTQIGKDDVPTKAEPANKHDDLKPKGTVFYAFMRVNYRSFSWSDITQQQRRPGRSPRNTKENGKTRAKTEIIGRRGVTDVGMRHGRLPKEKNTVWQRFREKFHNYLEAKSAKRSSESRNHFFIRLASLRFKISNLIARSKASREETFTYTLILIWFYSCKN